MSNSSKTLGEILQELDQSTSGRPAVTPPTTARRMSLLNKLPLFRSSSALDARRASTSDASYVVAVQHHQPAAAAAPAPAAAPAAAAAAATATAAQIEAAAHLPGTGFSVGNRGGSRYGDLFHRKQSASGASSSSSATTDHVTTMFTHQQSKSVHQLEDDKAYAPPPSSSAASSFLDGGEPSIRRYYEHSIWANYEMPSTTSSSSHDSAADAAGEVAAESFVSVNVEKDDQLVTVTVLASSNVRDVISAACDQLERWDDYNYRLFYREQDRWLAEDETIASLALSPYVVLRLAPDVSQQQPAPEKQAGTMAGGSMRAKNMFSTTSFRKRPSVVGGIFGKPDFKKKYKQGEVYLAVFMYHKTEQGMQVLVTPSTGLLPSVLISKDTRKKQQQQQLWTSDMGDFQWAIKRSLEFENAAREKSDLDISELFKNLGNDASEFRRGFVGAIVAMKAALGVDFFGVMHDEPVTTLEGATLLVVMLDVALNVANELVSRPLSDLGPILPLSRSHTSNLAVNFARIHKNRLNQLEKGLHVATFFAYNNYAGLNLLVFKHHRHIIPSVRLRDRANLDQDEWSWLRGKDSTSQFFAPATPGKNEATTVEQAQTRLRNDRRQIVESQRKLRQTSSSDDLLPPASPVGSPIEKFQSSVLQALETLIKVTNVPFLGRDLFPEIVYLDEAKQIGLLVFVHPMYAIPEEDILAKFDAESVSFTPLPVFEALHQHIYNNSRSRSARRRLTDLEDKVHQIEVALKSTALEGKQRLDLQDKLAELQQRISEERGYLRDLSWTIKLFEWDSNRSVRRAYY